MKGCPHPLTPGRVSGIIQTVRFNGGAGEAGRGEARSGGAAARAEADTQAVAARRALDSALSYPYGA